MAFKSGLAFLWQRYALKVGRLLPGSLSRLGEGQGEGDENAITDQLNEVVMTHFTAPWLVEGSFEKTLRGLMAMADPGAFAGLSPEQIREALVDELRFIAPYDENEEQAAEAYIHRQEKHAHEVVMHVASQLQRLGKAFLRTIAERMVQLAGESPLAGNLPDNVEALAVLTAARMVSHREVTEVVGFLVSLMQDVDQEQADKIASIVSHLLPLNYAPGAARQLSERMTKEQFGLLEDEVSTRTLAEIIMAGYDQKPAKFAGFTADNDLHGGRWIRRVPRPL